MKSVMMTAASRVSATGMTYDSIRSKISMKQRSHLREHLPRHRVPKSTLHNSNFAAQQTHGPKSKKGRANMFATMKALKSLQNNVVTSGKGTWVLTYLRWFLKSLIIFSAR